MGYVQTNYGLSAQPEARIATAQNGVATCTRHPSNRHPSARVVRRFVAGCVAGHAGLDVDLAVLIASELATNAIVHSRLAFHVSVDVTATCVQVAVDDLSAVLPVVGQPREEDTGGRGLAIIEAAADRWGIKPTAGGKRAWFELCGGSLCVNHRTTT